MNKKNLGEESYLEFRQGSFDNWCDSGKEFYGYPKDTEYFTYMQDLYPRFPSIYNAFLLIYDLTDAEYSDRLATTITLISQEISSEFNYYIDLCLSLLYMGMVAEENKENTKLGKRIKRLGVHLLLFENYTPEKAANSLKGVSWQKLNKERGF